MAGIPETKTDFMWHLLTFIRKQNVFITPEEEGLLRLTNEFYSLGFSVFVCFQCIYV